MHAFLRISASFLTNNNNIEQKTVLNYGNCLENKNNDNERGLKHIKNKYRNTFVKMGGINCI